MDGFSLDSVKLQNYQPNRYPFLMIDFVDLVIPGVSAKGFKNLTSNEWFFPKHFPSAPNMPGALQLEALAQMLTVAVTTLPGLKGSVVHGLKHTVRFKREVKPGDKLVLDTKINSFKRGVINGVGTASVNNEIACQASLMISIPEEFKKFIPKK